MQRVTDEDREKIQFVFDKLPIRIESTDARNVELEQYGVALITELVKDVKNNSTEQARKEAAEKHNKLTAALQMCVDALYEAIQIAPLDRLPNKAADAIQQAQAILGEIKQ